MIVVVTGGRHYPFKHVVDRTLDGLPITTLIHGACGWSADSPKQMRQYDLEGADKLADDWALRRGVLVLRVPASWARYNRMAGPMRNAEMMSMRPDAVVAFPGGRGTRNAVREARMRGIPVIVVEGGG